LICPQNTSISSACILWHDSFYWYIVRTRSPTALQCEVKAKCFCLSLSGCTRLLAQVSPPVVEQSSVSVVITRWSHRPSDDSTTDSVTFLQPLTPTLLVSAASGVSSRSHCPFLRPLYLRGFFFVFFFFERGPVPGSSSPEEVGALFWAADSILPAARTILSFAAVNVPKRWLWKRESFAPQTLSPSIPSGYETVVQ
jgi:hypothetical protein